MEAKRDEIYNSASNVNLILKRNNYNLFRSNCFLSINGSIFLIENRPERNIGLMYRSLRLIPISYLKMKTVQLIYID